MVLPISSLSRQILDTASQAAPTLAQLPVGPSQTSASALDFLPFYHEEKPSGSRICATPQDSHLPECFTPAVTLWLRPPAYSGEEQNNKRRIKTSKAKYPKRKKFHKCVRSAVELALAN